MAKDNWETPWIFINTISKEFKLSLDVCTDGKNAKCDLFLTNSLNYDWASIVKMTGGGFVWCNPPYSNPTPWVDKLIETLDDGVGSLMLVNASTSAKWFHRALSRCAEIWIFKGRISFIDPDTGLPGTGNDRSQVMFIFDPLHVGSCNIKSVNISDYQTCKRNQS